MRLPAVSHPGAINAIPPTQHQALQMRQRLKPGPSRPAPTPTQFRSRDLASLPLIDNISSGTPEAIGNGMPPPTDTVEPTTGSSHTGRICVPGPPRAVGARGLDNLSGKSEFFQVREVSHREALSIGPEVPTAPQLTTTITNPPQHRLHVLFRAGHKLPQGLSSQ